MSDENDLKFDSKKLIELKSFIEAQKKKKQPSEEKTKTPDIEIYERLFAERLVQKSRIVKASNKEHFSLASINDVNKVIPMSESDFKVKLMSEAKHCSEEIFSYMIQERHQKQCLNYCMVNLPVISEEDIKPIIFQPTEEQTRSRETRKNIPYHYAEVPFSLLQNPSVEKFPTWSKLINRMDYGETFVEFIGSIFHSESDRSQYLWLRGEGGDGKSTAMLAIGELLGSMVQFDEADRKSMRYAGDGWQGKRLVIFDDIRNTSFTNQALIRQTTGGAMLTVRGAFQKESTFMPTCKLIFTSNHLPTFTGQDSDLRRCILINIESLSADEERTSFAKYVKALKGELPAFISYAYNLYSKRNSEHEPIEFDTNVARQVAEKSESEFEGVVQRWLNPRNGAYMRVAEMNEVERLSGWQGQGSQKTKTAFREYLEREYGIVQNRAIVQDSEGNSKRVRVYENVEFAPNPSSKI